jgi:receptor expression-enhancing protein 5/6
VGVALPVYSTFKAIETKDQNEQQRWLLYWAAYGSFSIAEVFTDKLISWFPLYYHMKFAFLVWLQLPSVDGAKQLYVNHLRPFLLKHQARLDQIVELSYGEMGKFVSAHQGEIQFAKTLIVKIWMSANEMASDIFHPGQRRGAAAIEGPRTLHSTSNNVIEGPETQAENSESENDE